jgi:hypothetical protein
MVIVPMPEMFWSFNIRILKLFRISVLRVSDLNVLKILLFDKFRFYVDVTMWSRRKGLE